MITEINLIEFADGTRGMRVEYSNDYSTTYFHRLDGNLVFSITHDEQGNDVIDGDQMDRKLVPYTAGTIRDIIIAMSGSDFILCPNSLGGMKSEITDSLEKLAPQFGLTQKGSGWVLANGAEKAVA